MYELLIEQLRTCSCTSTCETCQYWYEHCEDNLIKNAADATEELDMKLHGANAAIAGMQREIERMVIDSVNSKPQWIPVTERLPEDMVEVLCYYEYFRYGNYNRMYRTIDRGHVFEGRWFGEAGEGHKNKVFAWMPLPDPYKPKEGE